MHNGVAKDFGARDEEQQWSPPTEIMNLNRNGQNVLSCIYCGSRILKYFGAENQTFHLKYSFSVTCTLSPGTSTPHAPHPAATLIMRH
jgi:hypothetical protein